MVKVTPERSVDRIGWRGPLGHDPRQSSRLVNRLRLGGGHLVTYDELVDALWPDDLDGAPLTCRSSLTVLVTRLRQAGFPIGIIWGRGYYYGGRAIVDCAPPADPVESSGASEARMARLLILLAGPTRDATAAFADVPGTDAIPACSGAPRGPARWGPPAEPMAR